MVLINLNNRDMELKYDFNAMCAIEEKTGKGIQTLINENVAIFSLCRLLIWAGLRHLNPSLGIDIVGSWIHEEFKKGVGIEDFAVLYSKALMESGLFERQNENEPVGEIVPVD